MPASGYYQTNYRALRFREMLRMYGWRRAPWLYLVTRRMRPGGIAWFPGLWSESECRRENLSDEFWRATTFHRKNFEQLGFTEIGFQNNPQNLNSLIRDSGGIRYWNPAHTCFGQLLYNRIYRSTKRAETNQIIIAFTAVFDDGTSLTCTNHKKAFDTLAESNVIRLDSNDAVFIHQRFLQELQLRNQTPRTFPDVDSLRRWYDNHQQKLLEERVNRRLFLPATEKEVAAARRRFESKAPPIPRKVRVKFLTTAIWLIIIGCIVLLQVLRHHVPMKSRSTADTMEYRGQQFKTRNCAPP
jgi:hypothetical protein